MRAWLLPLLLLTACASTHAPIQVGENTWLITGHDSWAASNENGVVERLTQEAQQHCASRGQSMEMVDVRAHKTYARPAEGRITYECVEAATAEDIAP